MNPARLTLVRRATSFLIACVGLVPLATFAQPGTTKATIPPDVGSAAAPPSTDGTEEGDESDPAPTAPPPATPPPADPIPSKSEVPHELLQSAGTRQTALAVSGGISLGSYEAGVNWTLLRLLDESAHGGLPDIPLMKLRAMTGASAGNINAFLGALEHCQDHSKDKKRTDPVLDNWFANAWLDIGIDQLFPGKQTCEQYMRATGNAAQLQADGTCKEEDLKLYGDDDGAFSRRAFDKILAKIHQQITTGSFKNGCGFPIGITVTKVVPEQVEGLGVTNLDVTTQRFAALLNAEVRHGKLIFTQPRSNSSGDLVGNRLYLPELGGRVPLQHVLDLILASSAFPVAFGPVQLDYCLSKHLNSNGVCRPRANATPKKLQCDDDGKRKFGPRCAAFVDGGLFDNLPLGLAVNALRSELKVLDDDEQPVILYMDPDKVRWQGKMPSYMPGVSRTPQATLSCLLTKEEKEKKKNRNKKEPERGVAHLVNMLGRFVTIARTYEMQSLVRFDSETDAVVDATDRYSPIFGTYLGAFASFLSRPLREYDYHVGIYDGLYYGAAQACTKTSESDQAECLLTAIPRYAKALGVKDQSATMYIVNQLLRSELTVIVPKHQWVDFERKHHDTLAELASTKTDDKIIIELHRAMVLSQAYGAALQQEAKFSWVLDQADGVRKYLDTCDDTDLRCKEVTQSDRLLFTNREALLGDLAKQLAQRLVDIEREEEGKTGNQVVGVAQFVTEVYFNGKEPRPRWRWSPSTVPSGEKPGWRILSGVLPHVATAEVLHGGAELGYLPSYYSGGLLGLSFPLSPFSWSRLGTFDARAGVSATANTGWLVFSRFELGPYASFSYKTDTDVSLADRFNVGGELATQMFLNKLRLSLNLGGGPSGELASGLRVGVTDLNGILYWLGRVSL